MGELESRKGRKGSSVFLLILTVTIFYFYGTYLKFCLLPDLKTNLSYNNYYFLIAIIFHVHFFLFIWAVISAAVTEPGTVPKLWGFYVGDEARRKRYCRVCNVWKPDRTHHCSQCSRCVLNMDHHCPWISNCVGFYNRKFFIQTLIYANICLITLMSHVACKLFIYAIEYQDDSSLRSKENFTQWGMNIILLTFSIVILMGLIPFTRFHWHLLISNSTTIESIDSSFKEHARYDLGVRRNIEQVFGVDALLWWLPRHTNKSAPNGDGIRWRRHYLRNVEAGV